MKKKNKSILFVTYGGGHSQIVSLLAQYIQKNAVALDVSVLALTTASDDFKRDGVSYETCAGLLERCNYDKSVMALGAELAADNWNPSSRVSYEETCAYLGISMHDLSQKLGEEKAHAQYRELGRKAFCATQFMSRVLDVLTPELVITTCYVRMEKAATIAGNDKGIPTLIIEDLLGFSVLGDNFYAPQLVSEKEKLPSYACVMNESVKQNFISCGYASEEVFVTGQPVFSNWKEQFENTQVPQKLASQCSNRKVITYVAPARKEVVQAHVETLSKVANKVSDDILWLIKLHPSMTSHDFFQIAGKLPENLTVIENLDILPVAKVTDCIITFRSTVGLMSLFFDIPLVIMDYPGLDEDIPYVSSKNAKLAANEAQLLQLVMELLREDKKTKRVLTADSIFYNSPTPLQDLTTTFKKLVKLQ